jgi:eukaryotic-like serine/threonine-protein kinase
MDLSPGSRLGRYEIRSRLGAGGMGEVFVAYDPELEREVAIKVIREGQHESSDRVRRFVQEAKVASALNHPNIAYVYEIGSQDAHRFIVMELVNGETLRARMKRGPLSVDEALSLGIQIAAGLDAAHQAGIIHRDIKPENIMIRPDGYAKVLDFGLAKLLELRNPDAVTLLHTRPGAVMGTLGYMSPEQISGVDVTAASDVFSFGVVLYEMVTGHRPFEGKSASEVTAGILTTVPRRVSDDRPGTPPKLSAVIGRALEKEAEDRYPDAGALLAELRLISRETTAAAMRMNADEGEAVVRRALRRRLLPVAILLLVLAGGGVAWWKWSRANEVRTAQSAIARAEAFLEKREYGSAYAAALAASGVLTGDGRVTDVLTKSSQPLVVDSDPPGARVFLQKASGPSSRVSLGTTPLHIQRYARGEYVLTIEKAGYVTATRLVNTTPVFVRGNQTPDRLDRVRIQLLPVAQAVPGMVLVTGGEYHLEGWSRPSDRAVQLDDFLIDRYEVSNRDFEQFVRAGGYRNAALWKHPMMFGDQTVPFAQAMTRFRDTTGLPGPRNWVNGAPPAGRENHPVSNVSWYEAAAFAEWKGKKLPTIYQWEKAARHPQKAAVANTLPWGMVFEGMDARARANFEGKDTMAVDSLLLGMSPFGAHHMAGNVSEWCSNPQGPGFARRGGGWSDPMYVFGKTAGYPAAYSDPTLGFRCVRDLKPRRDEADQGGFALEAQEEPPVYEPVDDAAFARIRERYAYVHTPLNARIVEVVTTPDWRREKIEFTAAPGRTAFAYLYLPSGFRGPLQVIHFSPAGDVGSGWRPLASSIEANLPAFIRGGRAVFSVAQEGFFDRPHPADFVEPDSRSPQFIEYVVTQVTELRRGLDYLQTRKDIDASRIAFMGPSAGSWAGVILTALEPRYKSVLFIGTGIHPSEAMDVQPANRIHFAPRIAANKLLIQGLYDEDSPLRTQAEPLYRLFREPKRLFTYEGGHSPPLAIMVPTVTNWLDETLGPVVQ